MKQADASAEGANMSAEGTDFSGGPGHSPWEIFEIGLSETPFPAFPEQNKPQLYLWEKKYKIIRFIYSSEIIISCENTGPYMSNDRTLRPASGLKRSLC